MRHLAMGKGKIKELDDLRGPMAAVLDVFMAQQKELERYRQQFGALSPEPVVEEVFHDDEPIVEMNGTTEYDDDMEEGSDTAQE